MLIGGGFWQHKKLQTWSWQQFSCNTATVLSSILNGNYFRYLVQTNTVDTHCRSSPPGTIPVMFYKNLLDKWIFCGSSFVFFFYWSSSIASTLIDTKNSKLALSSVHCIFTFVTYKHISQYGKYVILGRPSWGLSVKSFSFQKNFPLCAHAAVMT